MSLDSPDDSTTQPDPPVGPNRFRPRAQLVSHLPSVQRQPLQAFYTLPLVAAMLSLSYKTVWYWVQIGKIKAVRLQSTKRSTLRIPEREVLKLLSTFER